MSFEEGVCFFIPSQWRDLQKANSMEVLSVIRGEPQIVDRFLELARSKIREDGRLSPPQSVTAFRLSSRMFRLA